MNLQKLKCPDTGTVWDSILEFLYHKRFRLINVPMQGLPLLLLVIPFLSNAQMELGEMVSVPKTPEAAAFTEYANTASVSLHTGKASVSIPIDALSGRNMSHPISLSYLTGGIKVREEAGIAGLGWHLNAGGMVSRNVNGLPDDYTYSGTNYLPFYSDALYPNSGLTYYDLYKEFNEKDYGVYFDGAESGKIYEGNYQPYVSGGFHELYRDFERRVTKLKDIDISPDTYTFNAGGISGTLIINYEDNSAYCIEHPDYRVEVLFESPNVNGVKPINSWTITDNHGTIYEFDQYETTSVISDTGPKHSDDSRSYISGWYLSSIYNPYFNDRYQFVYGGTYTSSEYEIPGYGASIAGGNDTGKEACSTNLSPADAGAVKYIYSKRRLSEILVNAKLRADFSYSSRQDLSIEKKLNSIALYNSNGRKINTYNFSYSYFGTPDLSDAVNGEYRSRLKLDSVGILGDSLSLEQLNYSFIYNEEIKLPNRNSKAQDYWGYFNGASNNQSLVPADPVLDASAGGMGNLVVGNREVSKLHMQAGVLKEVHYPTGGHTLFSYTSNAYTGRDDNITTESLGGFRFTGGSYPGNEDPSGYNQCDPQAGVTGTPRVMFDAFVVDEEDVYDITVTTSGDPSDAVQGVAIRKGSFSLCEALQPDDLNSFEFLELNPDHFGTVQQLLTPGKYQVMIINDQSDQQVSLEVTRDVVSNSLVSIPVGGLRIISKQDYDEMGRIAKNTVYRYKNVTVANTKPVSGVLHHIPNFKVYNTAEVEQNVLAVQCENATRFASNQNTATPNIVTYGSVSVMDLYSDGKPNGATVYRFYNDFEGVQGLPFIKKQIRNGLLRDKWVYKTDGDGNYELIASDHNSYDVVQLGSTRGFQLNSQASAFLDPMIEQSLSDLNIAKWVYKPMYLGKLSNQQGEDQTSIIIQTNAVTEFINGIRVSVSSTSIEIEDAGEGGGSSGTSSGFMMPCAFDHDPDWEPQDKDHHDDMVYETIKEFACNLHNCTEDVLTSLYLNGDLPFYIDPNDIVLECIKVPDQIAIYYKQPYAFGRLWLQQDTAISYQYENGLEIKNIQTFTYDETPGTTQFQVLSVDSETANGRIETIRNYYPQTQIFLEQNRVTVPTRVDRRLDGVLQSIKKTEFDAVGRVEVIQLAQRSPGHDGTIAVSLENRIEILEYNDLNNKVQKMRDQSGLIHYYKWDQTGQYLILHLQIDDPDFEHLLSRDIDPSIQNEAYRNYLTYSALPNSLVSTYEYEPGIGLIRQIDPNGRSTYYEYDHFGRLYRVLDQEGNILSQNNYHLINSN